MSVFYRFKVEHVENLDPDEYGNARYRVYPVGYEGEVPAEVARAADEAKAGERLTKTEAKAAKDKGDE